MRALLLAGLTLIGAALPAAAETISIVVDQARVLRIARPASTIIIGNPAIADATIQDARTLVITGRSYGVTNLIILDENGDAIADSQLHVGGPEIARVTVYRSTSRFSYDCGARCDPLILPGDNDDHFVVTRRQTLQRTELSAGQASQEPEQFSE